MNVCFEGINSFTYFGGPNVEFSGFLENFHLSVLLRSKELCSAGDIALLDIF